MLIAFYFVSCTQKDNAIGLNVTDSSQDELLDTLTIKTLVKFDTLVKPSRLANGEFLYLAKKLESNSDTILTSDFALDLAINSADSTIDSAVLKLPIYNGEIENSENIIIDIYKLNSGWSETSEDSLSGMYSSMTIFDSLYLKNDTSVTEPYKLEMVIDHATISNWGAEKDAGNGFKGLLFKIRDGISVSSPIKLYSSEWKYQSHKPTLTKYTTHVNTTTDSSYVTTTISYPTQDVSIVKKAENLVTENGSFRIGAISGEGVVCKFDLSAIPENAYILTGGIRLTKTSSDEDFGDLKKLALYKNTDSTWYEDITKLKYDSVNVWEFDVDTSKASTYLDIDAIVKYWHNSPDNYYGFYLRPYKWGYSLGSTVFNNLKLEVTYIKPKE